TVSALLFVALTTVHLDDPGVYYDELHQATAAFYYLGHKPTMFSWEVHGVPILNMSYSGAVKSTLYGLYLRYVEPRFTVYSWRLFGVIFVAAAILAFYVIAGHLLPLSGGLVFAFLLLSDVTVLLTTRHDWGPTALALALRLVFLAIWLSLALS